MKNRDDLINAFNATCTEYPKGLGEVETYEHWLERQLIHRMEVIETYEAKFNNVDLASVMPRCKTCKHFKKTYDAKQSWIDRVEEAKRLYHNISEKAAVTLANNKDLWEQTESGNGFCKWHCLNEQIPDHMSCADHES